MRVPRQHCSTWHGQTDKPPFQCHWECVAGIEWYHNILIPFCFLYHSGGLRYMRTAKASLRQKVKYLETPQRTDSKESPSTFRCLKIPAAIFRLRWTSFASSSVILRKQNESVTLWLERASKCHLVPPPALGHHSWQQQIRSVKALSRWILNPSRIKSPLIP